MKKTILTLALSTTLVASAALAEDVPASGMPMMGGHMMGKPGMMCPQGAKECPMGGGYRGNFEEADKDSDGKLSKEEFLGNAEERFKKIDTDGNASISPDEMQAYRHQKNMQMREFWKQKHEGGMMQQGAPVTAEPPATPKE